MAMDVAMPKPAPPATAAGGEPEVAAVDVRALEVSRGRRPVLTGVSLRLDPGRVLSVLGPNGAGKTTLVKAICGSLRADRGTIEICGLDVARRLSRVKRLIGITPQDDNLYEHLTVEENLRLHCQLFGMARPRIRERIAEVLGLVGLADSRRTPVRKLSGGMKRRVVIARCLSHEPDVLLLDEPTTGLDPVARQEIWSIVRGLGQRRAAVLLTTHSMEEAETLSHQVVVLNAGAVVATGTPDDLRRRHVGDLLVEFSGLADADVELTARRFEGARPVPGGRVLVPVPDVAAVSSLLEEVRRDGIVPLAAHTRRSTLEDVFFALTGRGLQTGA